MFEENENPVIEDITENVEEQATEELVDGAEDVVDIDTTEETPKGKFYTDEEIKNIKLRYGKRIESKIRKDYDEKYGDLENVLKAGTGAEDVESITGTLKDFYTKKGVKIPERNNYSENDLKILAGAEADEIISYGYDEVVEEVDRLADKGLENMTNREKIVFQRLATYRQSKDRENELASIGVSKDVLSNAEFTTFASQFNSNVPIKDVYNMWTKTQPAKKLEQIGSMKNTTPSKVKDTYTEAEISKLTLDDLNDPDVWEAVRKSMTKQN